MLSYLDYLDNESVIGIIVRTCGFVDTRLMNHGLRVSYIVSKMLNVLGTYDPVKMRDICILSVVHDIGAYKTEEINRMLEFETQKVNEHSVYGYLFIKYFSPLEQIAQGVLYHHTPWKDLIDNDEIDDEVKEISQMIYISDRWDIYFERGKSLEDFKENIEKERDKTYSSKIVDTFLKIDLSDYTGYDYSKDNDFLEMLHGTNFTTEEIENYLQMIISTIDFRSIHTVPHTITTTSISREIARVMELDEDYSDKITCGAMLHDLGKIGIPMEILDYPGRLSPQAMEIMKSHVTITEKILDGYISDEIKNLAIRHHEKLDGRGYPYGLKDEDLTLGERIVAIADIISALYGTRSYKEAFSKDKIIDAISELRDKQLLDFNVVNTVILNYDKIMDETIKRCEPVIKIYDNMHLEYDELREYFI